MKTMLRALALVAVTHLAATTSALSHEIKVGDLVVSNLWTRATPGGAKVAGGYLTVTNNGTSADKLLSVSSPVSGKSEIHEMAITNGVMTMRPLDAGLLIDAGKTVTLAPGGYHLMLMDLKEPLKEGAQTPVTLQFEKAGKVETYLHVQGVGAKGPDDGAMKGHSDHKH